MARFGGWGTGRNERGGKLGWWDRRRSWEIGGGSAYLMVASRDKGGKGNRRKKVEDI